MSQFPMPDRYKPPVQVERKYTSRWCAASLIFGLAGFCFWLVASIPAIVFGIVGLRKAIHSDGRIGGHAMAIVGLATGILSTVFPVIPMVVYVTIVRPLQTAARDADRKAQSMENLKQLSLATTTFRQDRSAFPQAADTSSGAAVSWRTQIAPFLDSEYQASAYHFDESWDGQANFPISTKTPSFLRNPTLHDVPDGQTNYLAIVGKDTIFPAGQSVALLEDTASTILFVEADEHLAVPWTQPKDIDFDPNDPLAAVGTLRPHIFLTVFADASVRILSSDIDEDVFRAMVTRTAKDNDPVHKHFFMD